VLLLHGTADGVVPFDQSLECQRRLRSFGVRADLIPGEGGDHGHIHRRPFFGPPLERMRHVLVEVLGS
jgi:dipeptidyl aminopeptidase/acylaminoacyl peptidase